MGENSGDKREASKAIVASIKDRIGRRSNVVDYGEIADEVIAETPPEVISAWMQRFVRRHIIDLILATNHHDRLGVVAGLTTELAANGSETVASFMERQAGKLLDLFEDVGGQSMRLRDMSRRDVLAARALRQSQARGHLRFIALYDWMLPKLEEGDVVGKRFADHVVEREFSRISHSLDPSPNEAAHGTPIDRPSLRPLSRKNPVPGQANGRHPKAPRGHRGMAEGAGRS